MTTRDLMTTEFPVTLPDGTALRVQALSVEGEDRIIRELSRKLYESYGAGGYFQSMKASLDYMQKNNMGAAYTTAVQELTRLTATKTRPGFDAVFDFRQTPDGLAAELFLRTRKTHPELAEAIIRSQLNDVTAWQVCAEMMEGLAEDSKRRSAGADATAE